MSTLIASIAYLLWENRPRRINYAFVVDESAYTDFFGVRSSTIVVIIGLPLLGALLGLVIAILLSRFRRS